MSENSTKWQELVYRGVESDELDYKAAQNWEKPLICPNCPVGK